MGMLTENELGHAMMVNDMKTPQVATAKPETTRDQKIWPTSIDTHKVPKEPPEPPDGPLTLYIGNLPHKAPEVEPILHKFLESLQLESEYKLVSLRSCIHRKDNRQFAQIKLGSKADMETLLD